jgi:hypothetical protein
MKAMIPAIALAVIVSAATEPCRADDSVVLGAENMHLFTMNKTTRRVTDYSYDLVENTNTVVDRGALPVLGPNFIPAGIALTDDVRWPVAIWMFDPVAGVTKVCRATTAKVFECR